MTAVAGIAGARVSPSLPPYFAQSCKKFNGKPLVFKIPAKNQKNLN
jgi:hypothetical protein